MGYAKDIAAGMVSHWHECKVKHIFPILLTLWNLFKFSLSKAYLHSMNVIHRDLNSHNCLVRQVTKLFHCIDYNEQDRLK